ncbi:MAG TPA: hypothetical protein VK559_10925 [Ferruginibacter sp.]|nr:hypothetical protein [Ferruginibacter sp.]
MSYLNRILNNCSEASLLALKSKEETLSFKQKFETRFHIYFCKCCKNFEKQSGKIDTSLKAFFKDIENKDVKASESFKNKMKELIK